MSRFNKDTDLNGHFKNHKRKKNKFLKKINSVSENSVFHFTVNNFNIVSNDYVFISVSVKENGGNSYTDDYQFSLNIDKREMLQNIPILTNDIYPNAIIYNNLTGHKSIAGDNTFFGLELSKYKGKKIEIDCYIESKDENSTTSIDISETNLLFVFFYKIFTNKYVLKEGNHSSGTTGPRKPPTG